MNLINRFQFQQLNLLTWGEVAGRGTVSPDLDKSHLGRGSLEGTSTLLAKCNQRPSPRDKNKIEKNSMKQTNNKWIGVIATS
ncbi:MAG: hypothetical protein ACXWKG_20660, partial [Limisphaerales bacterium]